MNLRVAVRFRISDFPGYLNVLASNGKIPMKVRQTFAAVALLCLFGSARLSADVIIDWNNVMYDSVRTNSMSPLPATRISAAMNTAMYDAINSIVRTHRPYHFDTTAAPGTSREAAAAQAAHRVLSALIPANQATYDAALTNSLSNVPDGPGKTAGVALGNTVGAAILALRANDGASVVVPYTPGSQPGEWKPTPPGESCGSRPAMGHRDPVGDVQPFSVSESGRSTRIGQRRIHGRVQPSERNRLCDQHHANTRPVEHCPVLGGPRRHRHSSWSLEQDCSDGCPVPR